MRDSKRLFRTVLAYLRADQYHCRVNVKERTILVGFRGNHGLYHLRLAVHEEPLALGVYLMLPIVVPENRRLAVAETITRCNFGLRFGCFELHMSGGTLGFRNHFPVADGTLTQEQFRVLISSTCGVVDDYFRALLRLLYGDDLSPAEVVAEVEMAK